MQLLEQMPQGSQSSGCSGAQTDGFHEHGSKELSSDYFIKLLALAMMLCESRPWNGICVEGRKRA